MVTLAHMSATLAVEDDAYPGDALGEAFPAHWSGLMGVWRVVGVEKKGEDLIQVRRTQAAGVEGERWVCVRAWTAEARFFDAPVPLAMTMQPWLSGTRALWQTLGFAKCPDAPAMFVPMMRARGRRHESCSVGTGRQRREDTVMAVAVAVAVDGLQRTGRPRVVTAPPALQRPSAPALHPSPSPRLRKQRSQRTTPKLCSELAGKLHRRPSLLTNHPP